MLAFGFLIDLLQGLVGAIIGNRGYSRAPTREESWRDYAERDGPPGRGKRTK